MRSDLALVGMLIRSRPAAVWTDERGRSCEPLPFVNVTIRGPGNGGKTRLSSVWPYVSLGNEPRHAQPVEVERRRDGSPRAVTDTDDRHHDGHVSASTSSPAKARRIKVCAACVVNAQKSKPGL